MLGKNKGFYILKKNCFFYTIKRVLFEISSFYLHILRFFAHIISTYFVAYIAC